MGLVLAFTAFRGVSGMLVGVGPTDRLIIGGAALFLIAVTLVASYWPARRAGRPDERGALPVAVRHAVPDDCGDRMLRWTLPGPCPQCGSARDRLQVRLPSFPEPTGSEGKSPLRVLDESGEDYLFEQTLFVPIEVPEGAAPAFMAHAPANR